MPRGYKRYLLEGDESIPRTTGWRNNINRTYDVPIESQNDNGQDLIDQVSNSLLTVNVTCITQI